MKEYIIPSTNFIGAWFIDDKVCDGLISYFDESPDQGPGEIGQGVNEKYKVSTDVAVIPRVKDERIQIYLDTLGRVCDNYIERYPWCSTNHSGWGINTNFNIQKYNPGEGFYGWHTERSTYKDLVGT